MLCNKENCLNCTIDRCVEDYTKEERKKAVYDVWYQKNKEKRKAYQHQYYLKRKEQKMKGVAV